MGNYVSIIYILIFTTIISYILSNKTIKQIIKITKKVNLSFYSDQRRSSSKNKSRLGGIGILISQLFCFYLGVFILNNVFNFEFLISLPIVFTTLSFCLIGIFDDLFSINPFFRLIFQFIISFAAWNFGLRLEFINLTDYTLYNLDFLYLSLVNIFLSSFWIVGLTNAINWLDGLDGLAASFSAIVFFIFGLIFLHIEEYSLVLLCFASVGSCLGFLKYNFFPSKIFMGDGGSYFLGSLLACITIQLNSNINNNPLKFQDVELPIVTFLIFFVPVIDMIIVVLSRIKNRISPFYPDKSHFHHKLKKIGLNAVDIVYLNSSFTQWLGFSTLLCLGIIKFYDISLAISFLIFFLTTLMYALKIKKYKKN